MSSDARERILDAAARLLVSAGSEGVSTRAVAAAAGVQAPTLYRLFGDKQGLLDAVAAHGYERYLAEKHALAPTDDPMRDLRRGWDLHVEFGITHPASYRLMFGTVRSGQPLATAADAHRILLAMLRRVADAGGLIVPPDVAARMIHAACIGVTLTTIATPAESRDAEVSRRVRDAILSAVTASPADPAPTTLAARALALDAALDAAVGATADTAVDATATAALDAALGSTLTAAEVGLLRQWLDRLAGH